MKNLERTRLIKTINTYEQLGWQIDDYTQDTSNLFDYHLISPNGRVYNSNEISYNLCSFCKEDDDLCIHDQKLLDEEKEAKNLLNFIKLLEGVAYCPILP